MTTDAVLKHANNDLVALGLIQAILDQRGGIGSRMPDGGDGGKSWAQTGFVLVSIVGGSPNVYARGLRRPVIDVQAKWIALASKQPPWSLANELAERIIAGCYRVNASPIQAILPAGYERAFVQSAYPLTEPRRIGGDPSSIATYQFDMQVNWVPEGVG